MSGIGEEFIAMQLDLEIPLVITILKDLGVYRSESNEEIASNASNPIDK